jgi:hypothetical protein
MTEEERRIISDYVMRVAGAQPAAPAATPWGGRPTTGQASAPQLPPVEPEADRLIADLFTRYPEARFRITQTAFVQEHALVAANNRIQELEYQLEATRRQAESAKSRGIFGFGGRPAAPMPPPPQPQYPPNYNPQALQGRQGPGFLGTAMMTAAGVAGGMVLGNMLMGAIGGGGAAAAAGLGGAAGGTGAFGQEAVPTSSPWTDPGTAASDAGYTGGNDASGSYDSAASDASGSYDTAGYDDSSGSYDDGGGYEET